MQKKTIEISEAFAEISLNVHKGKRNIRGTNSITHDSEALKQVEASNTWITDKHDVSDANVIKQTDKAKTTFLRLKYIWNSKELSANNSVSIFYTNAKTILLYGLETQRH